MSGVPQGCVLGPIVCLVYINDLEKWVTVKLLKFADDSKLLGKTKEIGDKQKLQDYIDKLVRLSEKWQMLFNFVKSKYLHTWPGITVMYSEMGGTIPSKTVKEKYLGVTMNANRKVSEQCRIAASKGKAKTEYMCLNGTPLGSVKLQSAQLPQVTEFKYLGSTMQSDGDMTTEINKRNQCGWNNWRKMLGVLREYHHTLKERYTRRSFSQLCCTGWRQCQSLAHT